MIVFVNPQLSPKGKKWLIIIIIIIAFVILGFGVLSEFTELL